MRRVFATLAAGAIALATAGSASAQVTMSFGNPLTNRFGQITVGAPGVGIGGYGVPGVGLPGVGTPAYGYGGIPAYTNYSTGIYGNPGYGVGVAPYTYSSGYRGYVLPSYTAYRYRQDVSSYGYPAGFYGGGQPYSAYGVPFGSNTTIRTPLGRVSILPGVR